jgi:hypothetical protein
VVLRIVVLLIIIQALLEPEEMVEVEVPAEKAVDFQVETMQLLVQQVEVLHLRVQIMERVIPVLKAQLVEMELMGQMV